MANEVIIESRLRNSAGAVVPRRGGGLQPAQQGQLKFTKRYIPENGDGFHRPHPTLTALRAANEVKTHAA